MSMYSYANNAVYTGVAHMIFNDCGNCDNILSLNRCGITDVRIEGSIRGGKIPGLMIWQHMSGDAFVMHFHDNGVEHELIYKGSETYYLDGVRAEFK